MPKVSVIIPVYGVEKYIERCARSLFEQTIRDIEYVFIDDCTKDNSIRILERVLLEYPYRVAQVKIIHNKVNKGSAFTRRVGMIAATGDYIIHCDGDDWVVADMYESMYNRAVLTDSDVISCDFIIHNGSSTIKEIKENSGSNIKEYINNLMVEKAHWSLWNKLFRRSLLEKDIEYPTESVGEDMALVFQLMYFCKSFVHISTPYYYYYINGNSLTRNQSDESLSYKRFCQTLSNYYIIERFYKLKGCDKEYKKGLNYLKVRCKSHLDYTKRLNRVYWFRTFPFVEFICIFNSKISNAQRKYVLINSLNFIYYSIRAFFCVSTK